jgi:hypothetical protein
MVVNNLQDSHRSNRIQIDPAIIKARKGIMVWRKDQSIRTPERNREAAPAVGVQGVQIARRAIHVGKRRCAA